jgi:two-component system, cell cycle response regulator CtrA
MEMRLLLIENETGVAHSIELLLKSENMRVLTTNFERVGIDLAALGEFDVVLLSVNPPDMSGLDVLRTFRAARIKTPVLLVFNFSGIESMIKELGLGPSEYILNPIQKDELIARIHAIVQRARRPAHPVITIGDLIVNLEKHIVDVAGTRVHLTGKEYQMLELLALRKGTTLTKEMLLNHLYGGVGEPGLKIIDVFVCKLRKKLANASHGKNYIETVWGRGYLLRAPLESEAKIPA